ncbi:MAG: DNA polymerase-3 subunit chi [Pseudohongiellaceae bacterium]|jgi:DNA polymerase-3 subunit chi
MAQINFYALAEDKIGNVDERLTLVCRIADKAYGLGHRIYIFAASEAQALRLDSLLWDFKASSFLPHELSADTDQSKICISHVEPGPLFTEVVINLSEKAITSPARLVRLNELVGPDNASLQAGREHFRTYKAQGLEIETHRI